MYPAICRCCGATFNVRAPSNTNVCKACAISSTTLPGVEDVIAEVRGEEEHRAAEMESLLEMESPSVLDCYYAVEQAKQALAEALASERDRACPGKRASKARAASGSANRGKASKRPLPA